MSLDRRNLLRLGGVAAGAAAVAGSVRAFWPERQFDFVEVARPAGFRRIPRGDGLSAATLLSGVETTAPSFAPLSDARVCDLTFAGHRTGQGHLAIALFSDFFCPYCRVLDVQVREWAAKDNRIVVVPHEVPLLGRASEIAARAVIAAEAQGAYEAFHARLIRTTFVPNPAYLRDLAKGEGLDLEQFQRDLTSPDTTHRIENSIALFRTFGFVGTPALVVGRTLVNGSISRGDLRALMRLELEGEAPTACA